MASAIDTIGITAWSTKPTVIADTATNTTASSTMTRRLRRKSTRGTWSAEAYSSGGRISTSTTSGSISNEGNAGTRLTPMPTTTSSRGAATPIRLAK